MNGLKHAPDHSPAHGAQLHAYSKGLDVHVCTAESVFRICHACQL